MLRNKDFKWCPGCKEWLKRSGDYSPRTVEGRVYARSLCKNCEKISRKCRA